MKKLALLCVLLPSLLCAGRDIVPLLGKYGLELTATNELFFNASDRQTAVSFQQYNTIFAIDTFLFTMREPFYFHDGRALINDLDYHFISVYLGKKKYASVIPAARTNVNIQEQDVPRLPANYSGQTNVRINAIFIDAGHGGKDPGALGYGFQEKDMTLTFARLLAEKISSDFPKKKTIMTRSSDTYVALEKRCDLANSRLEKEENGVFVSLHLNASFFPETAGLEVYYLSYDPDSENARVVAKAENTAFNLDNKDLTRLENWQKIFPRLEIVQYQKESRLIAELIDKSFSRSLSVARPVEKIRSALFYVLQGAIMPSVLVEIGYITNKDDITRMADTETQQKIIAAIAEGLAEYIRQFERSDGFTRPL